MLLNLPSTPAMPCKRGRNFTIATANVELDETYARAFPEVAPGAYVLLSIGDTGCGMASEIQAQLFEPFFTTKEPGKGTGLGLCTVASIIKECGGHIRVFSEPGQGTTFKIYLPIVSDGQPHEGHGHRNGRSKGG